MSPEIEYPDLGGTKKGRISYKRRENRFIFSALQGYDKVASSVQAAERIVVAICEAEGLDWREPEFFEKHEFYDLSTPIGYPSRNDELWRRVRLSHGLGDVELDKLEIVPTGNYINVESWTPINVPEERAALLSPPDPNS
jgi:hypothetical protein